MTPSRRLRSPSGTTPARPLPFINALAAAGHEFVQNVNDDADVAADRPRPAVPARTRTMLERYARRDAKIFLYPHGGGGPILSYDGLWEPDPRVVANLVTGVGHAEYLRRIDYPRRDAHDRLVLLRHAAVPAVRRRPTRRLRADAPERRRLDDELPARPQRRGLPPAARRRPLRAHRPPHRHARAERPVEGRRRRVRQRPPCAPRSPRSTSTDAVVAGDGTFPTLAIARGVPTVIYGQGVVALGLPGEEPIVAEPPAPLPGLLRYPVRRRRRPARGRSSARGRAQRGADRRLEAPLRRRAVRPARVRRRCSSGS